ncbi:hypothetical protein [Paenibacillus ginsengarvi]|uniref:Nucleotidyl transferase AbiEii/AbiGii toxin family protein n=1 Tax=Paenibacillus ginsengarvi TaxID=400777 RepID=A0A3B0CH03_9BACL|nr:hypothetical protein [Paenibacillus ginsengarvi]RKN84592.1 hypothetical protein D7M11_11390 [Paenibacillus ginsengarvi]
MEKLPYTTNRIFEPAEGLVPNAVLRALRVIGGRLEHGDSKWLVGGSCGALLQNVPLPAAPRDLDVYADVQDAPGIHAALADFSTDEQVYSETGMYGSLLSHYSIEGVQVELVGSLKVRLDEADYEVRVRSLLSVYADTAVSDGIRIPLMPLGHELLFNVLRERQDRYWFLAETMRMAPERHLPLMDELMRGNRIGTAYADWIAELLGLPSPLGGGNG